MSVSTVVSSRQSAKRVGDTRSPFHPPHVSSTLAYHHLYESLLERQRAYLICIATRSVGPTDAEDLAQIALLEAYRGLPSYRGEWERAALSRWMRGILAHLIADHQRQAISRNECTLDDTQEFLTPAQISREWQAVREAIYELIPTVGMTYLQRRCVVQRLQGETETEIAAELEVSQPMVSKHFAAGMEKLQEHAPETIAYLFISSPMFRALCKATIYHKPQTVGSGLAKEKLRRLR